MGRTQVSLASWYGAVLLSLIASQSQKAAFADVPPEKEWALLVFLNGNNDLDQFGSLNMNQMEKIGSTDKVDVVVQWASLARGSTARTHIQRDTKPYKVTSPVLEELGEVDMGSWRTLAEFIRWGIARFPAKRYFVAVWDHGSGWRLKGGRSEGLTPFGQIFPTDISHDDRTGNKITTPELGRAIAEGAQALGRKIDLLGTDACLMAMTEVATEVKDSTQVFLGSQELEPGAGWPYDTFLRKWNEEPTASASRVAEILVDEYLKSYSGGTNGTQEVTLSALDLDRSQEFLDGVSGLHRAISALGPQEKQRIVSEFQASQSFYYSDYVDVQDFLERVERAQVPGIDPEVIGSALRATRAYIIANGASSLYPGANGVSIWAPQSAETFRRHFARYQELRFQSLTNWSETLGSLFQ